MIAFTPARSAASFNLVFAAVTKASTLETCCAFSVLVKFKSELIFSLIIVASASMLVKAFCFASSNDFDSTVFCKSSLSPFFPCSSCLSVSEAAFT